MPLHGVVSGAEQSTTPAVWTPRQGSRSRAVFSRELRHHETAETFRLWASRAGISRTFHNWTKRWCGTSTRSSLTAKPGHVASKVYKTRVQIPRDYAQETPMLGRGAPSSQPPISRLDDGGSATQHAICRSRGSVYQCSSGYGTAARRTKFSQIFLTNEFFQPVKCRRAKYRPFSVFVVSIGRR